MPRTPIRNGNGAPRTGASKYDAHHKVLSQTYGAFADLRRELSDSKNTVSEREDKVTAALLELWSLQPGWLRVGFSRASGF